MLISFGLITLCTYILIALKVRGCVYTICGAIDERGIYANVHSETLEGMHFYTEWLKSESTFIVNDTDCVLEVLHFDGGTACAAGNSTLELENLVDVYLSFADSRQCTAFFLSDLYSELEQTTLTNLLYEHSGYPVFSPWVYPGDSNATFAIGQFNGFLRSLGEFQRAFYTEPLSTELLFSTSRKVYTAFPRLITKSNKTFDIRGVETEDDIDDAYIKKATLPLLGDGEVDINALKLRFSQFADSLDLLLFFYPTEEELNVLNDLTNQDLIKAKNVAVVLPFFLRGVNVLSLPNYFQTSGRWPLSANNGYTDGKYLGDTDNFINKYTLAQSVFPNDNNVYGAEIMALKHLAIEIGGCSAPDQANSGAIKLYSDCLLDALLSETKKNNMTSIFSSDIDFRLTKSGDKIVMQNIAFNPEVSQNIDGKSESVLSQQLVPAPFPKVETKSVSIGWLVTMLVAASLLISAIIFTICFVIYKRDTSIMKSSAYPYLLVMLFGMIVHICSIFAAAPIQTDLLCNLTIWLYALGFFLTWLALIIKTYQLYRALLFTQNVTSATKLRTIYLCILLCFLILLGICTGLDYSLAEKEYLDPIVVYMDCSHTYFVYIFFGIQSLTVFSAILISYQVKNAPLAFNESKFCFIVSIGTLFLILLYFLIEFAFDIEGRDATFKFVSLSLYVLLSNLLLFVFFFFPKFYYCYQEQKHGSAAVGGLKKSLQSSSGGKDQTTIQIYLPDNEKKPETWKKWKLSKWDTTMSAKEQRAAIENMIESFNHLLDNANHLSETVQAQKSLLLSSGVSQQKQTAYLANFIQAKQSHAHPRPSSATSINSQCHVIDCSESRAPMLQGGLVRDNDLNRVAIEEDGHSAEVI